MTRTLADARRNHLAVFPFLLAALAAVPSLSAAAGEKAGGAGRMPPLLSDHLLPPPRANPNSNIDPQPDAQPPAKTPRTPPAPPKTREALGDAEAGEELTEAGPRPEAPPTPEAVERYRVKLEERLGERYNNLPDFAGQVGAVMVILAKPVEVSLDGKLLRAEFDQLVYDQWGARLPQLEKEYYVVTFGSGGAETVRSDPGIRIGLDLEKVYSERVPLAADPFRHIRDDGIFGKEGAAKMPEWWRPDFPELE
ncbi:MAG: hypothetical protein LBU23_01285 [Planctomycetota bacterium]|nr:hypothetical protein [Planctomycetota bacterium]